MKLTCDQDSTYTAEETPRGWMNTKRITLPTWTVYARVGNPEHQPPHAGPFKPRAAAEEYIRHHQEPQPPTL